MYKKYHAIALIFLIVFLLLPATSFVLALEINYPVIPGAPQVGGEVSLTQYIQYFFIFLVVASGIIGVLSIVFSGIRILVSAGNPESISEARKNISTSVLGIILLMTSFIILRTINPNLVDPAGLVGERQPGFYLVDQLQGPPDPANPDPFQLLYFAQAPPIVYETADPDQIDPQFTRLFYYCPTGTTLPNLLVWVYNQPEFKLDINAAINGDPTVTTIKLVCGSSIQPSGANRNAIDIENRNIRSYITDAETVGVYFYLRSDCTGFRSYSYKKSDVLSNAFGSGFSGSIAKSAQIISGIEPNQRYGMVLNGENGECSIPIVNPVNPPQGYVCVRQDITTPQPNGDQPWPESVITTTSGGAVINPPIKPEAVNILSVNPSPINSKRIVDLQSSYLSSSLKSTTIGSSYIFPNDPPTYDSANFTYTNLPNSADQTEYNQFTADEALIGRHPLNQIAFRNGNPGQTVQWSQLGKVPPIAWDQPVPFDECSNAQSRPCLKFINIIGRFYVILYTRVYQAPSSTSNGFKFTANYPTCRIFENNAYVRWDKIFNFSRQVYRIAVVPRFQLTDRP